MDATLKATRRSTQLCARGMIATAAKLAVILALALCAMGWAASEKVLYRFHGRDGNGPVNVIIGPDGALYGTTVTGGTNCLSTGNGCGVVFRLAYGTDGKWHETVLHDFAGSDGSFPNGALVADKAGNLYGTTVYGGPACSQLGCGVVFELVRGSRGKWTFKVLHNFAITDGANPYAGMIFDLHGNLYGTTSSGGDVSACYDEGGCGVVFKLTPDGKGNWTETVVYAFGGPDGETPVAPVTFSSGNLYGTTENGGAHGSGTVFELTSVHGQWEEGLIHSFGFETADGDSPAAGVTLGSSGELYGTTQFGGTNNAQGWGTAFKLTPEAGGKWKETVLQTFDRDEPRGGFVSSGLILDAAGNLFGTAGEGGRYSLGVAFELRPGAADGKWGETVLHSFGKGNDGANPIGGLVFDPSDNLLGSASIGGLAGGSCGQAGCGVVFEITP